MSTRPDLLVEYVEDEVKKGIKKGIEKEMKKREKEIAKNLLQKGYSVEEIAEVTELDDDIILNLKAELK